VTLVAKILHAVSTHTDIRRDEAMPIAVACCVAIDRRINASTLRGMFSDLARDLTPADEADALTRVRDWLDEIELTEAQDRGLRSILPVDVLQPIDWTLELEALVDDARYREPFIPISPRVGAAIGLALELPKGDKVACLYAGSATIAWGLAQHRRVTLHVTNWQVEMVMALLAFADERPLRVDRRNPIETIPYADGTFAFSEHHAPQTGAYDHLISVPPLGYRMREGEAVGMLFEAWQVEQQAHRARKSFISLATDGLLFRESRSEAAFRERLCGNGGLTVTSLPPGIFGRASGVQVNLLKLDQAKEGDAFFVDGRTMERISRSGREQEDLIVNHLECLGSAPSRAVAIEELAASNFNLLPGRYLVSEDVARLQQALAARPTVRLGDIARVIRARAPQPNRGEPSDDDLEAWEIAVSDIVEGKVRSASKQVRFPSREQSSLNRLQVDGNDILISIKGNVGVVGIVERDDTAELFDDMLGIRTIVSQSLAIVRPALRGPIRSPRVLAAILGSPPMRAHLQALAGGTTVATLPISALQDLAIPVPDEEEAFQIEERLDHLDRLQKEIDERVSTRSTMHNVMWRQFWNMPPGQDEA